MNKPFIVGPNLELSYSDVFSRIRKISDQIVNSQHRALENSPIAILCDNKLDGLCSILSALRLNAPYIPLDNRAPFLRNMNILLDNNILNFIVSKSVYNENACEIEIHFDNYIKIELKELDSFLLTRKQEKSVKLTADVAYILFTSGSTGKPKGIQVTHENALSFILWSKQLISCNEKTVFCSVAPFQFDLSVFDIYVSILSGGKLVLFENEDIRNPRLMTQIIDDFQIEILYTTPTIYRLLWAFGKIKNRSLQSLRIMIFAGEIMPISTLNLMKEKCPNARLINFYGPTETNVCTWFDATYDDLNTNVNVPIGICTTFAKYKIEATNLSNRGELFIAGNSVFKGYLNNAELTNEKIKSANNELWYATGDMVFLDAKKQLNYIARIDRMVKVKGYRVELNEIENTIEQLKNITASAVVVKTQNGEKVIIAYVQEEVELHEFNSLEIKKHCSSLLPHYMIPNSIILLDEIPLNANSKVDYNTLSQW